MRRYAAPVLRHRIFANFAAASEGASPDEIVCRLLEHVKDPVADSSSRRAALLIFVFSIMGRSVSTGFYPLGGT